MTPKDVSRVGGRRTVTVLAVAALLFGSLVVTQTVSAGSPVTLSSDKTSATVLEGENVMFTLTLANAGTDFTWQTTKLYGTWLSGTEWFHLFSDEEGEALEGHGLVATEVGQVGTHGEQQGVDALLGHGDPCTVQALGEHCVRLWAVGRGNRAGPYRLPSATGTATAAAAAWRAW